MPHIGHCVDEYLGRRLSAAQQSRAEEHLLVCAYCRLLVARARQHRRHLAGAAVPQPSADLAQRILERTRCLDTAGNEELRLPYRVRRRRGKVLATGSAVAVVAVLGGAYLAGADAGPDAGIALARATAAPTASSAAPTAAAAVTSHWPVETPAAMAQLPPSAQLAGSALPRRGPQPPDWALPDAARPAAVDTADIATLKLAGWNCPELAAMGFSLHSAEGFVVAGVPTLELILANGSNTVRIYEQRPEDGAVGDNTAGGSAGESSAGTDRNAAPVNAITGHAASVDGFQPLSADGVQAWLRAAAAQGNPWQLVFRQNGATYTVSTDLPATALDPMTAAIAAAPGQVSPPASALPESNGQHGWAGWYSRIVRGLGRLVQW